MLQTQSLSESVNWSSNAKQIIENDEKEFEGNDLLLDHNNTEKNHLNMSWGNYFAKKSPPLGDLCGSHGVHTRPQFDQNDFNNRNNIQKQSELISEKNRSEEMKESKEKESEENSKDIITENEDTVIIHSEDANQTLENIDLNEFTDHYLPNRDSNDSHKSNQSNQSNQSQRFHNHKIHVPGIKYIQRFYQFTINKNQLNHDEIELIILKYTESYTNDTKIKCYLSAITYKKKSNGCTILILFENSDGCDQTECEWMNHFVSFPDIVQIMDTSKDPVFTELN